MAALHLLLYWCLLISLCLCCRLPLCCVIEDSVLVVHGGLSTADNVMLSDISAIRRGREPPESGLMSELLWSGELLHTLLHTYHYTHSEDLGSVVVLHSDVYLVVM